MTIFHRSRRSLVRVGLSAVFLLASMAYAQTGTTYPVKPIKLMVGFTAGVGADNLTRLLADRLGKKLNASVIVENRPGAGGNLAIQVLSQSPADGYTLALGATYMAVNDAFGRNTYRFDELVYLGNVSRTSNLLLVAPDSSFQSFSDLLVRAKAREISYASPGVGTSPHLGSELMKDMADLKMVHVPYSSMSALIVDLMAGRVDMYLGNSATGVPLVKAGKLRALAASGTRRVDGLPDVATISELGLAGFSSETHFMLLAPPGMSNAVVGVLSGALEQVMKDAEVRDAIGRLNMVPAYLGGHAIKTLMVEEAAMWKKTIQKTGLKLD